MVRPSAVRSGIGTALVARVLDAAAGRQVLAATGRDNVPATRLYAKHGFVAEDDVHVPPGVWMTRFRLGA